MKKTRKENLNMMAMLTIILFLNCAVSSCTSNNFDEKEGIGNDSQVLDSNNVKANLSDLVGEWVYEESATFQYTSDLEGDPDYETPLVGEIIEIRFENQKYFYELDNFFSVELVDNQGGGNAKTPQQTKIGATSEKFDMTVESGAIRKLSIGQIETKFHLSGEEIINGNTVKTGFTINGKAKRREN